MDNLTKRWLPPLMVLISTLPLHATLHAEDYVPCFYCGKWQPYNKAPTYPHLPGEFLTATETSINFPGCDSVNVIRIFSAAETSDISNHVAIDFLNSTKLADKEMVEIFVTQNNTTCTKPLPDFAEGSLVAISIIPRVGKDDSLLVSIFHPSLSEARKISPLALSIEELKKIKYILHPKELVSWELIRIHSGYSVCEIPYEWSATICSNARFYDADGELNEEWRKLKNILPDKILKETISKQRQWISEVSDEKKCKDKNDAQFNSRWVLAFETNCKADLYKNRAIELRNYRECFLEHKTDCSRLINKSQ